MLLGAGLDTFAQRRPDVAARLRVFEVGQQRYFAGRADGLRMSTGEDFLVAAT